MKRIIKNVVIAVAVAVGAAGLVGGGAALGYDAGAARSDAGADTPKLVACNLELRWDRVAERYQAVYEDSGFVADTPRWGRTANLSCTDAQILDWQEARRVNGLDDQVCRPMIDSTPEGIVIVDGCAVPKVVVARERR